MLAAAESAGNKACPVNYPVRAQQYVLQSIVRVVPAANAGGAGATAVPLPGKRTVLFSWNALRVPASVPTEQRAATLGVSLPGGNSPMGTQTMLSTDTSNQPAYSPPSGLPVSNQAPGKYAPPDGVPTITPPPAPFVRIPPPTPAALPPPPAPAAAPPLASGNNPAQIAQKARQVAAHQAGRVTSADGSGVDDPNGMGVATGGGATGGPSLNQAVIVWVPGRNSGFPRQFPAKITWVDREHNLAVATLDAAVLPADVAAPPLNTPQARVPLFAAQFEAAAKLDAKQEPTDVPPLDIVCDNDGAQALGAPLFDSYGHWVGFAAGAQTEQSTGEKLRRWLAGTVKNVTVDPAGFDPGVGGRITLHVEIASLLGPPERLELIVGSGRYARPAEMHFDRKTERYVASLTVPPAPGAADRPVDESKLPAPT
ncbi:MAG: hypothetical protein ACREJ2_18740, partial [Planctomycetota bacterium]